MRAAAEGTAEVGPTGGPPRRGTPGRLHVARGVGTGPRRAPSDQGSPPSRWRSSLPATAARTGPALTSEDGEAPHGGERVVAGRVEDVELVDFAADGVELAVEVLDGGRVGVLEAAREEARHDGRLAHLGRAEDDHAVAVLGRDTQLRVARAHLFDHRGQFHRAEGPRGRTPGREKYGGWLGARRGAARLGGCAPLGLGCRLGLGSGSSSAPALAQSRSLWFSAPGGRPYMQPAWPPRPAPSQPLCVTPREPPPPLPRPPRASARCRPLRAGRNRVPGPAGAKGARTPFSTRGAQQPQGRRVCSPGCASDPSWLGARTPPETRIHTDPHSLWASVYPGVTTAVQS